ncbi:cytochrome C [Candidatus Magnetoovum chiemensis]|nr:cytochrome C [Candidatus Magnetoovum chiemensis]
MKSLRLVLTIVISVVLLIPLTAAAKEAKTLKELIDMYDSSSCKQCHADYFKDWEHSLHSKPLLGPFDKTLGTLKDYLSQRENELKKSKEVTSSMKEYMMPCFICHVPQLEDASEEAAQELAKACMDENFDVLEQLTINCKICHNRNALPRKFRDGNPEPDAVYGVKETGSHAAPDFPKRIKSEMMQDPSFCGGCHQGPNLLHSAEPIWCTSNYDSYQQAYIPNGGDKTCQECHMEKTDYNATGHRFPPNYDDPELSMKRLKDNISFDMSVLAYTFAIKTPQVQSIPMVVVKTKVENKIGHRFPDGCPSPAHFALNITVNDKNGKNLFNEVRYYMPQKKLGYAENKMVFASLRKLSLMRDTSLQPFKDNTEEFEFKLPADVGDVTVTGTLTFVVEPGVEKSVFKLFEITKNASLKGE